MTPILVPDSGPLITLAYAEQLDLLQRPGWPVHIVDMVVHEVTRNRTPTSNTIADFINLRQLSIVNTQAFGLYRQRTSAAVAGDAPPKKAGLGELAIQEYMTRLGLENPATPAVFLFEDHKIARASFHLPNNVQRVSTRAFLIFLEEQGWIGSAAAIERQAILNGRHFSRLRFP
jgi:hypothetical protein